jgi:septum site-determining protein MinC
VRRAGMLAVALAAGSPGVEALSKALDLPLLSGVRGSRPAADVSRPAQPLAASAAPPVVIASPDPAGSLAGSADASTGTDHAREPAAAVAADASGSEVGSNQALIHGQTIRSGQRLYARGRDLIIMATVGAGAEVMADGCVHVYGSLRGRVMAGVRGDTDARVFCQEFRAELVSIAGVFRVFETIPADLAGKPVQAWLEGENLRFAPIRG